MNYFTDDSEEKAKSLAPIGGKSILEKAGFIMAAAIMLVVIVVMTTDVKGITFKTVADMSAQFFVLTFCTYGMYTSLYQNGTIAGERSSEYIEVTARYDELRKNMTVNGLHKRLTQFCREYVDTELKARCEDILSTAGIAWNDYLDYRHLSKGELREKGLSDLTISAILRAKRVRAIKLRSDMLLKNGRTSMRRRAMHVQPVVKKRADMAMHFVKTALTNGALGLIVCEVLVNPSWETVGAVALKLISVAFSGCSGYRAGYANITVNAVTFVQDQIDLLEEFKQWEAKASTTDEGLTYDKPSDQHNGSHAEGA